MLSALRRICFSISGIAATTTSPTICRLRALTCSRSSCGVCQVGFSRSMMSAAATPARRNGMWSSSIDGQLVRERRAVAEPCGGGPDDVDEPRRRVRVALDGQIAVADHVEQHERPQALERPVLLRGLHVVAAAVGVVGAPPLGHARFFAVEEQQLDRQLVLPCLEDASQLEQRGRRGGAVVGADEPELAKELGVVVAGEHEAVGAPAGNRAR